MNIKKTIEQLKTHEGLSLRVYKCVRGFLTIGFGRNLERNGISEQEQLSLFSEVYSYPVLMDQLKLNGITLEQANELLFNDVHRVATELNNRITVFSSLTEARKAVLINMAFQLGVSGLLSFKNTLSALAGGDILLCACEMENSRWHKQTPNRANELIVQLVTDKWQL